MSGLKEDSKFLLFASSFNLCQYIALIEVYVENLASQIYEVGKGKSILIAFSDNYNLL